MKRWALVTVGLYVLIMAALVMPLAVAAFGTEALGVFAEGFASIDEAWENAPFYLFSWGWILVMGLCQLGLLVVPVRAAAGRPVTKRWIVWPIIAALFLALLMVAAAGLAVYETIENTDELDDEGEIVLFIWLGVGAAWLVWTFLFGFYAGVREPTTFMSRLARGLIAGSILELLIAVPAHVLARVRNYCCAGFLTFWGLAVGLSVMLVAFGPATFILFARRFGSVKAPPKPASPPAGLA